ncbi:MAG: hypothetical protein VB141_11495 [Burkholderia gladioli]
MRDFVSFAQSHGVLITDLDPSGRIRRCGTVDYPRSKNGAYRWDGRRGFVYAWDADAIPHWFNDPESKPWSETEKRAFMARRQSERAGRMRDYQRAAQRAAELIRSASANEHNYFHYKGLPSASGLVLPDGGLLVPMRSLSGEIQGAQIIRWDGKAMRYDKRMLPGMRAKGAVLRLGSPRVSTTILCEGYATGLSIVMAVRQMRMDAAVRVCFSDSNLVHAASLVSGHKAVFTDNDASGAGERAARATGLPYCMSDVVGEDANDLHQRAGLFAVCGKLMGVRQQN